MHPTCDGRGMLRRIPSFSSVIARSEVMVRPLLGGSSRSARQGSSLADRIAIREQPQPPAGKALLRVQQPSVIEVTLTNGLVLFRGLRSAAMGSYLAVKAGTYDLVVEPAGEHCEALRLLGVTLQAGYVYTICS